MSLPPQVLKVTAWTFDIPSVSAELIFNGVVDAFIQRPETSNSPRCGKNQREDFMEPRQSFPVLREALECATLRIASVEKRNASGDDRCDTRSNRKFGIYGMASLQVDMLSVKAHSARLDQNTIERVSDDEAQKGIPKAFQVFSEFGAWILPWVLGWI